MEFLKVNYINTSTQLAVNSNTLTAANIYRRDPFFQYYTDGKNSDVLPMTMTVTFGAPAQLSRLALLDINFKEFRIFYNGATANSFVLTDGSTNASSYTTNAQTDLYLRFATITVDSITLEATKTITANQEKHIGLLLASDLYFASVRIPASGNYKPRRNPKQVEHTLSDGGTRIHTVRKKWSTTFSLDNIDKTLADNFEALFDLQSAFNFIPFGTSTAWDGLLFEANWPGAFEFYEYSDNASSSGFSGAVRLKETPV